MARDDDHGTVAGRRLQVRRSPIHGRGVFAVQDLPKGEWLLAYTGEVISWAKADRRYAEADGLTYLFDLDGERVIDAGVGGNSMRFVNHSCSPNCEAVQDGDTVTFRVKRAIPAGRELSIDYALVVDDPADEEIRELYACRCGARRCRGSMLAD